jgi:uncharacterized protein
MEKRDTRIPDTTMAEEVLIGLNNVFPIIKRMFGVKKIGIFGAFARRDPISVDSIELLVEFSPGFETYRYYIGLKSHLEAQFNTRINLITTRLLSESPDFIPSGIEGGNDSRDTVQQIIAEFELLQARCKDISVEAFTRDSMLRHAAERSMEIAGLAAHRTSSGKRAQDEKIPWKEIDEIGASIAGARFGADPHLLWHFIVTEVPGILKQLRPLLRTDPQGQQRNRRVSAADSQNTNE